GGGELLDRIDAGREDLPFAGRREIDLDRRFESRDANRRRIEVEPLRQRVERLERDQNLARFRRLPAGQIEEGKLAGGVVLRIAGGREDLRDQLPPLLRCADLLDGEDLEDLRSLLIAKGLVRERPPGVLARRPREREQSEDRGEHKARRSPRKMA